MIQYADEKDIKTFIKFSPKGLNLNLNSYKALLIENLLGPLYTSFYYKLGYFPVQTRYKNEKYSTLQHHEEYLIYESAFKYFYPLYLHLYALCECYNSYKTIIIENKKIEKEFKKRLLDVLKNNKELPEIYKTIEVDTNVITNKDKQKIFNLLINHYKKNRFYYYFNNDILVKLEIKEIIKNKQKQYSYNETNYQLVDMNKSTHIIRKSDNLDFDLKKKLRRYFDNEELFQEIDEFDADNIFIEKFKEIISHNSFQDVKYFHEKITEVLNKPLKEFCKLCNPNPNNQNSTKLCRNCDDLLKKLNEFSEAINEIENNNKIFKFKSKLTRYSIYNELLKDINGNLYPVKKCKAILNKTIYDIQKEIDIELSGCKYESKNYYSVLKQKITEIIEIFQKAFPD